jgi:threonine/homoserine/homoserine lactone efflux protein
MNVEQLLIYSLVSFFYIISPGPAIFLAISNGITADAKTVIMSSMGNIVGLFVLSSASMLGLGALLATSATLFLIVKITGAAYLVYLGIKQFRTQQLILSNVIAANVRQHRLPSYFREGFLLAVSNPKPILFFTAIFPQFLNADFAIMPQFLIMTAIFMLISFVALFSYGYVSKSAKHLLADQKRMMWFHRLTGGIFIGMGLGLLQLKNSQS